MRVAVIGAEVLGLVNAACLAESGHEVVCIDADAARLAALRNGDHPVREPRLAALLARGRRIGVLGPAFKPNMASAARRADPTGSGARGRRPQRPFNPRSRAASRGGLAR